MQTQTRVLPFNPTPTNADTDRAFRLLDTPADNCTKSDLFCLWTVACATDGKDATVLTHIFAPDNLFAIKAREVKLALVGND